MENMSKAIARRGRLKPEIRLAQAVSNFAVILDEDQRKSFARLKSRSPPRWSDVISLSEDITRRGLRLHRSWDGQGMRLVPILDRIQQFVRIGDVIIGGSQNMIASGVWAAVRMSLEVSGRPARPIPCERCMLRR
jgi:hypothetical protein